ncbi:MAG TPA: FHA domain-containing protein [Amycolatopsis sp.]|nr:FHA domain-containing protein [Amycolatopsis sp.]
MPVCAQGHDSADDEFCDVCGLAFDSPGPAAAAPVPPAEPPPAARPCPVCGAPLEGRFCESCGSDSLAAVATPPVAETPPAAEMPPVAEAPAEPVAGGMSVLVAADRAYYDTVRAQGGDPVEFPPFCPERRFTLRGGQMSIGRRSVSRGILPDIDLTGPPEDAGVSRLHAVLVAEGDSWSIVDMDSANGTYLNDSSTPLKPNTPHPLAPGDRVHLGAWTTLTLTTG